MTLRSDIEAIVARNGVDLAAVDRHHSKMAADQEVQAFLAIDLAKDSGLRAQQWKRVWANADGLGMWARRMHGVTVCMLHTVARYGDDVWGHVSVSRKDGIMPSWELLRDCGWAIYPELDGIEVVARKENHFSGEGWTEKPVLHLWYNLSRSDWLPDFTAVFGTI